MALYFEGYSQSQIADKLKINQSTVSLHVEKFRALAEQDSVKAAGKEYGIMNQVEALHSLAGELKAAKLTVEEAKVAVEMILLFQKCGVKQEEYHDLVQACTKMKSEDLIESAVKLNQLENSTGMTWEEIVTEAASAHQQLKQTEAQLHSMASELDASNEELAAIDKKKKVASQNLSAHMKQVGVDMNRLKLVEDLALALKQASISNNELQEFIHRQQLVNKAGVELDTLTAILEKAKVATAYDGGKELFKRMSEYTGLVEAVKALQIKVEVLHKQADSLEEQIKLKGKIESEIAKLKAEKPSLEAYVVTLYSQKDELGHIKSEVSSLGEKKAKLDHEITKLETYKDSLGDDVKSREQKVSDLKQLESKRDALLQSLSQIEEKLKRDEKGWEIFEALLGLVQSSSLPDLEKFIQVLPSLLDNVKLGKYSPELLGIYILKQLAGPALQLLKCTRCQAKFAVDRSPNTGGYKCPICGFSGTVKVDKDALDILKAQLPTLKQERPIVVGGARWIRKQPSTNEETKG